MNGVEVHFGFADLIAHLKMFTAPAYRSVAEPLGTASNSRLYVPCSTPQPSISPQFVIPASEIAVHDPPPLRLCQMPPSCGVPKASRKTYQAYISFRPGTTLISPRYMGQVRSLDVDCGGHAVVLSTAPPGCAP